MDSITLENLNIVQENIEKNLQLVRLCKCIKNLNESDKSIITLYLEELPYKEISEITGLKENNIAVKIMRIKNKLLKNMREAL